MATEQGYDAFLGEMPLGHRGLFQSWSLDFV